MSIKSLAPMFVLIAGLSASQGNAAERIEGPEFNQKTPRAAIPIDCDLMGLNGEETEAFVRQYAVPTHIRGMSLEEAKSHMKRLHGIEQSHFDRGRELCDIHFPSQK